MFLSGKELTKTETALYADEKKKKRRGKKNTEEKKHLP